MIDKKMEKKVLNRMFQVCINALDELGLIHSISGAFVDGNLILTIGVDKK